MGKKSKPQDTNTFHCFICQDEKLNRDDYQMCLHNTLKVTICDSCNDQHCTEGKWHSSREWKERDDNGKCIYCEICGEGGTLLPCDNCSFSFCTNKCLVNWLGEKQLNELLEDESIEFFCFNCVPKDSLSVKFPVYEKFLKKTEQQRNIKPKKKPKKKVESDNEMSGYESDEIDFENLPSPPAPSKGRKRKNEDDDDSDDDKPLKTPSKTPKKSSPTKKQQIAKFTCYSCFEKCDMTPEFMPKYHPARGRKPNQKPHKIIVCDSCYNYVDSDDWTYTDGKSDYCTISGEGGEIYSCDDCPNSFCAVVMEHFLGKQVFKKISADDNAPFVCWTCDQNVGNYKKFMKQSEISLDHFNHSSPKTPAKSEKIVSPKKSTSKKSSTKPQKSSDSDKENTNSAVDSFTSPKPKYSIMDSPNKKQKSFDKKSDKKKGTTAVVKPEPQKIDKDFFNSSSSEDDDEPILKKDPETRAKEQMKEILKISASEHESTKTWKAVMEILESK